MVFLGFGKYVRADRIYALEPIIGEDRGQRPPHARLGRGNGGARWSPRARRRRSSRRWAPSRPAARPRRSAQRRSDQPQLFPDGDLSAQELLAGSLHDVARGLLGWTLLQDGVGGAHRRGRGLRAGRSREPRVPRPHAPQRLDVRPARDALRLPLVRRPLVRERRLRAGGTRRRGAAARARADARAGRDARAARQRPRPRALLGPRAADAGARRSRRRRRSRSIASRPSRSCRPRPRSSRRHDRASASRGRPSFPGATSSRARAGCPAAHDQRHLEALARRDAGLGRLLEHRAGGPLS